MDKDYLSVARKFRNNIPVVSGLDNQWQGTLKQRVASVVSKFTLHKYFSHIFAAGKPQVKFANNLGFHAEQVLTGYYSADVPYFRKYYSQNKGQKEKFPKRFIYVGRYVPEKGLLDLWDAFVQLQAEYPNDWELWCIGTGPLVEDAIQHPKIKHFGFVQPYDLGKYLSDTGVFVLPSHYEPWGVVVHEFAAAGYPLLCSTKVGAATEFLQNNVNGYLFKSGNKTELKKALLNFVKLSDLELNKMGDISAEEALRITPEIWSRRLLSLVNK
nr:glycosyltransferase family 4 protein [Pontibacter harenae]